MTDPRRARLTALVKKFPVFDPAWPDEVQAKWFALFDRLWLATMESSSGTRDAFWFDAGFGL